MSARAKPILSRISIKFIIARLAAGIPVMITVITISFIVMRFAPGGPFEREKPLPPQIRQNLERQYNLDKPILPLYRSSPNTPEHSKDVELERRFEAAHKVTSLSTRWRLVTDLEGIKSTQLISYFGQVLRADLGVSMKYTQTRINDILARTFPVSIALGALSFIFAYAFGVGLGVLAASRKGSAIDRLSMFVATAGLSLPNFVLGAGLILTFALWLKWLPAGLWEGPSYIILPALTLALAPASYIARLTRSGMLDVMDEDYIRTAQAKGLSQRAVLLKHALINAAGPLITIAGPLLATLVTGSFIVEHIFAIPGMGRYFITAVIDRDYPMIMGVTIIYAALIVIANIVVDVLYAVVDPRTRL